MMKRKSKALAEEHVEKHVKKKITTYQPNLDLALPRLT
jgi:hypothetical protein